jgi:integral membrane sensor domain MASE1
MQQDREAGGMSQPASRPTPTLRRRWLLLARAAWVAVAFVALGSFVISVPARYAQLANPTAGVRAALAEMGLSAGGYALYNVTLDTVFVSVFALVANSHLSALILVSRTRSARQVAFYSDGNVIALLSTNR